MTRRRPEVVLAAALRHDGDRLVAAVAKRTGDIEGAEDAVQQAALQALEAWQGQVPASPVAWLFTTALRRAIDHLRRTRRMVSADGVRAEAEAPTEMGDERLGLLFAVCHPAVEPRNQVGLALRTLGGLDNEAIARAFLEPVQTTSRRLSRTSAKIRDNGIRIEVPSPRHRPARLAAVLAAVYLLFNEGYAPARADVPVRPEVCAEALRLAGAVASWMPDEPEVLGLLALCTFHHARRDGRTRDGAFVPLDQQDRTCWHRDEIARGEEFLGAAIAMGRPGPYQLQAAIAGLHAAAPRAADTDWAQITALYGALLQHQPTPVVELNAAMAMARVAGPTRALAWLDRIDASGALDHSALLHAARAELLGQVGRTKDARHALDRAIQRVPTGPERRHLERRRDELGRRRRRRARHPTTRPPLTDRDWTRVRALFPPRAPGRGRPPRPDREALEAVLWVLRNGAPWRELPRHHGAWQSAYHRFRQWEQDGRMAEVLRRLGALG